MDEQQSGEDRKDQSAGTPSIDQQIELEKAKAATLEAERKNNKQKARAENAKLLKKGLGRLSGKSIAIIVVAVAAVAAVAFVAMQAMKPQETPKYLAASDLENVIAVSNISSVDCVYEGVAIKHDDSWLLPTDNYIKYKAHVRAGFDMRNIGFDIDEESKTITVTVPEPVIDAPELDDEESLEFLGGKFDGNIAEAIALCKEDVAKEVKTEEMITSKAYANIQSTIRALTYPLIGDEYDLVWLDSEGQPLGGEVA